MYEIIDILKRSKIVLHVEVLELVNERTVQSIKIKAKLRNESLLFIHEVISEKGYKYSYHWQDKDSKLLLRWDNAPHYKRVETFPHHKHVSGSIKSTHKVNINEILEHIEEIINK